MSSCVSSCLRDRGHIRLGAESYGRVDAGAIGGSQQGPPWIAGSSTVGAATHLALGPQGSNELRHLLRCGKNNSSVIGNRSAL